MAPCVGLPAKGKLAPHVSGGINFSARQAPVRVALLATAFLLAAACLCGLEGRGRDLTIEGYFRASFSSLSSPARQLGRPRPRRRGAPGLRREGRAEDRADAAGRPDRIRPPPSSPAPTPPRLTAGRRWLLGAAGAALLSLALALARRRPPPAIAAAATPRPFQAVRGLFRQEDGTQFPRVIYPNFGARVPWPEVHAAITPRRKLFFFVRHGQGYHNVANREMDFRSIALAQSTSWCSWKQSNDLFDSLLTPTGVAQTQSLHAALQSREGLQAMLPAGQSLRVLCSPLRRCIQTASLAFAGLTPEPIDVSELCRETIGLAPPEARHSISDPAPDSFTAPCPYEQGLRSLYGDVVRINISEYGPQLPIRREEYPAFLSRGAPLGVLSDEDPVWRDPHRPVALLESREEMVMRANLFLASVFDNVEDPVVAIVTHSVFMAVVSEVVGQRPYFPQNCEVVPILIEDCRTTAAWDV